MKLTRNAGKLNMPRSFIKINCSSTFYYLFFGFIFLHLAKEMLQVASDGWYVGQINLYGDLVFHIALINKFLNSTNILVDSPILSGDKINYPIFVDYITSIFARVASIDFALFITTAIGGLLVLITSRLFIETFIKNSKVVFLTLLLFFFNGGLGFYYFFQDLIKSRKTPLEFLLTMPNNYTDMKDLGYWWINSLLAYFIPQRGFLFAFPITLIILLLLYRGTQKNKRLFFIFAGILAGCLPLVQAHSLFFIFLMVLMCFPFTLMKSNNFQFRLTNWILFGAITTGFALPLFKIISSVSDPFSFIRLDLGWVSKENIVWFWLKNLGIFAPMLFVSLIWLYKKSKLFILYLPFLAIFIASNIWIFQPWEFDNSKLIIYWYFASCIVVAAFLVNTFFTENIVKKIAGLAIVVIMIFAGFLDILRTFTPATYYQIYTKDDLKIANQMKILTPEDAIVVSASNHNHPIPTLAGRSTVVGYHGWLWSHGINFENRAKDVLVIYQGENAAEVLIKKYKAHYVVVGPQELHDFSINLSYYRTFPQVHLSSGWTLYDVSSLWSDDNR